MFTGSGSAISATQTVTGYSGTATEQQQVGRLVQALQENEHLLQCLNDEIAALEQRLTPFLRPDQPANGPSGPSTPTPLECPLASELGSRNVRIQTAVYRLRSVMARLDI